MRPTSEVHAETVALVSDAVVAITERAVRPALAPFQQELRTLANSLDQKINEIDDLLRVDEEGRRKLLHEVTQAIADVTARINVLADSHRGQVEEIRRLGDHLTALTQSTRGMEGVYTEGDRSRREDAQRLDEHLAALSRGISGLDAALAHHTTTVSHRLRRLRALTVGGLAVAGAIALTSAALGLVLLLS